MKMITQRDRLVSNFIDLVSIDSKTFYEADMSEYILTKLKKLGFTISQDNASEPLNGTCGNIYAYKQGTIDAAPLLFCTHMDTVEPCENKKVIIEADGIIRSDGTTILGADDCSGIAAILEAIETINEQNIPHRPIELLFTIAEEVYCKGAAHFDYKTLKSKEAYVLDLDGRVGTAAYKAPTIITFDANIKGKASHAGFAPQEGVHAISAAVNAVNSLELGQIDEETTLNIGKIIGGIADNIVPEQCTVSGEIRSYSHGKALETVEVVNNKFVKASKKLGAKLNFSYTTHIKAYETDVKHSVISRFERTCKNNDIPFKLTKTFGGSDNNYLANNGISGIVIASAMNKCHSCEEYTEIDELHRLADISYSLMTSED